MANITPTQHPSEGTHLTKPVEWAHYMVTAALKFAADEKMPVMYATADQGRMDILNKLNFCEAHDEYAWPDFPELGYDFSQTMRLRRALINDVFTALKRADSIKVSSMEVVLAGTPESSAGIAEKRCTSGSHISEQKRQCKREDESDVENDACMGITFDMSTPTRSSYICMNKLAEAQK